MARILGIDPGSLFMGYAIMDTHDKDLSVVTLGICDVHKYPDYYGRLRQEIVFIETLVTDYTPTELAIETQFVDKNPQTMIKIVQAQSMAIATALRHEIPIYEYSPQKVKMSITGNGHASKEQVCGMLCRQLPLIANELPKKLDATDALAIAYCHFIQTSSPVHTTSIHKSWTAYAKQKGLVEPSTDVNKYLLSQLKK